VMSVTAAAALLSAEAAHSYELDTHVAMTRHVFDKSVLAILYRAHY
jgi:hypothetical protein